MFKAEAGPCATPRKPNAHNDRTKTYTECSVTSDNSPIEADQHGLGGVDRDTTDACVTVLDSYQIQTSQSP